MELSDTSEEGEPLMCCEKKSEYELQREANIKRNNEVLERVMTAAHTHQSPKKKRKRRKTKPSLASARHKPVVDQISKEDCDWSWPRKLASGCCVEIKSRSSDSKWVSMPVVNK